VAGPNREGPPQVENVSEATQVIAHFEWENQLGVYDFCGEQYFSWIRAPHVLIRGERGEIHNQTVRRLLDFQTPLASELRREVAGEGGNLEGHHLKGYSVGDDWIYRNPLAPGRLSDDEIAVACCLEGMAKFLDSGQPFYSLAEAMHDRYLDLWMEKALESGESVSPPPPPWIRAVA